MIYNERYGTIMLKKTISFVVAAVMLIAAFSSIPANVAEAADGALRGKTIILDAGHGVGSTNIYAGYDEGATMFVLANKIKPMLESHGAAVRMTRPEKNNISVYIRAARVNIWALGAVKDAGQANAGEIDRLIGIMQEIIEDPEKNAAIYMNYPFDYDFNRVIHPDLKKAFEYENHSAIRDNFLMISLHSNATGSPINESINGANAFYMANEQEWIKNYYNGYSYEKYSLNFANKILDNLDKIGIKKRKAEADCYVVIREHNVPAVLIENGFHTNDADRAKLSDDKFLDKLAQAYTDAVIEYFSEIAPPETDPMQRINAKDVKVTMNGHFVNLTENPILFEGEIYFPAGDIARISGYAIDDSGILYRGEKYELQKPLVSGGKLYIGAAELFFIQEFVFWAEADIDASNVRVQFKINRQFEPKWDGSPPIFVKGELCVPLGPVLKLLGYTAERKDDLLAIYRGNEAIYYATETEYMIISDTLYMSVNRLESIKDILWASFDVEALD